MKNNELISQYKKNYDPSFKTLFLKSPENAMHYIDMSFRNFAIHEIERTEEAAELFYRIICDKCMWDGDMWNDVKEQMETMISLARSRLEMKNAYSHASEQIRKDVDVEMLENLKNLSHHE